MTAFYASLGIENNPSMAFHPQTDGQTERVNEELEQYFRVFLDYHQDDWTEWIPMAEFSYNNRVHVLTGFSPFYLMHGHHPHTPEVITTDASNESATQFVQRMHQIRNDASSALSRAANTMKRYYDRHRNEAVHYHFGDLVWLEATNMSSQGPSKKLDDRRLGPYAMDRQVGSSSYRLRLPGSTGRGHGTFHESLL